MLLPAKEDYRRVLNLLMNQFEKQLEEQAAKEWPQGQRGRRFSYSQRVLLLFFLQMHHQRRTSFSSWHRWLLLHRHQARQMGFARVPHRTTLMRRYKQLSRFLSPLIAFIGQWSRALAPAKASVAGARLVLHDKSLWKASGPVWHQRDRQAQVVPAGVKRLDKDATWGRSGYHGWVFGFGLHLSVDEHGFPLQACVETACVSEGQVVAQQEEALLGLGATDIVGDDSYTNLERSRRFARQGVAWLAPGKKLKTKGEARAYKRWVHQEHNQQVLRRRPRIEPVFELLSQIAGTGDNHKQLPVQGQKRVSTFLLGCVVLAQVAMILNRVWNLPPANISHMMTVWG